MPNEYLKSSEAAGGRIWCIDSETDPDAYPFALETRYFITDHLGSTRVVIGEDASILLRADYKPYGRLLDDSFLIYGENDYLWTGKELQGRAFFDTPWYDSGARFLTTTGIFTSIDPLAEKYPGVSPYAYCAGDPVSLLDKDGESPVAALGGLVIGGIVGGIIAACEGKEGEELIGAIVGGAITGAIAGATDGLSLVPDSMICASIVNSACFGALSGVAGSVAEQEIVSGTIDTQTTLKACASGAAAGAFTKTMGSLVFSRANNNIKANAFQGIEQKYESTAAQDAIRKEVKEEVHSTGRRLGKTTKREVNKIRGRQERNGNGKEQNNRHHQIDSDICECVRDRGSGRGSHDDLHKRSCDI